MNPGEMEVVSSCLALPERFVVSAIIPTETCISVHLICQTMAASCPLCQQPSERVHGTYRRTVADVPCGGRRVVLRWLIRKFVCATPTCPRQIFTERHAEFVQSYARMTNRLQAALQAVGLATGGEMGTRLADKLGVTTTPSTVLRQVMKLPIDLHPFVRVLGIDDFAWKKGRRYGTILVDLEAGKIIDILPDRTCATVTKWLAAHPEIEVISRDRGTDYAAAAREAAPQAKQIADRFHLVRNLADALQPLLSRSRTQHRQEHPPPPSSPSDPAPQARSLPHPDTWRPHSPNQVERRYQANQEERETRYQQIVELRAQGLLLKDIGQRLGMCERMVRRWLTDGAPPLHRRRTKRSSPFDPYAAFVLEQWQAGIHDGWDADL